MDRVTSLGRDSSLWRGGAGTTCSRGSRRGSRTRRTTRWAALERLPTFDEFDGGKAVEVDVGRLGARESRALIERLRLVRAADDDHERFLLKLKERMDCVGIDYPTIEVRYENLNVEARGGLPAAIHEELMNLLSHDRSIQGDEASRGATRARAPLLPPNMWSPTSAPP